MPDAGQESQDCLFCRIVAEEIPTRILYRSETVTGFLDIAVQAPIHVLFVANTHTASHLATDDPQIFADLLTAARDYARQEKLAHYRLVINNGSQVGQSVFHLHLHLLSGRQFSWPPG